MSVPERVVPHHLGEAQPRRGGHHGHQPHAAGDLLGARYGTDALRFQRVADAEVSGKNIHKKNKI